MMIRVLVVDDMPEMRLLLSAVVNMDADLELAGEAENGAEAITQAERFKPDVILLDIAMPVMDGLTALPEIMRVCPDTRVIMLSAYPRSQYGPRAYQAGAVRYLEKVSMPRDIVGAIKAVA